MPVNVSVVLFPYAMVAVPLRPGAGNGFIVTAVDVTDVVPQELVAASEYTPPEAALTVNAAGENEVDEKLLGPVHEYDVAPVAAPVSVSVAPGQSAVGEGVAVTPVGVVLTEIATEVTVVVPHELVAENVYTPAEPAETAKEGDCEVDE